MGKTNKVTDLTNKCYFCKIELRDEYYCHGCGWWICSEHDTEQPVGEHNVRDHYRLPTERRIQ